jgi:hypothetical protein
MSASRIEETGSADAIRQWAAERRLPDAHLRRWLALADDDRAALLELAGTLRMRTGQFVIAFELLEEIALRERAINGSIEKVEVTIAAVVARREIRRILDGAGSAPGRARELIEALRAIRFPRLKRAADRLAAEIAALRLPSGVRVILPRELSSDEVTIEISAHSGAKLEYLIDSVAAVRAGLGRIADLIGGVDSLDDEV